MNIIIRDPTLKKEDRYKQKTIMKGVDRLKQRLEQYNGLDISRIFGDDILIHDIIDKDKYVFKCRVNNIQVRILYTVNQDGDLVILSHWCKQETNKDYIRYFESLYSKKQDCVQVN